MNILVVLLKIYFLYILYFVHILALFTLQYGLGGGGGVKDSSPITQVIVRDGFSLFLNCVFNFDDNVIRRTDKMLTKSNYQT